MLDQRLNTLLTVVECGSYTKAGIKLSLTQPAITAQMKSLEKEYGSKLLFKTKNGLQPTPKGEIALKYAKRLAALEEKLKEEMSAEYVKTSLRIGITHTSESNTIAEVLAKYAGSHQNVSISIITDSINNLYEKLQNYEIDLAIVDEKRVIPNLNYIIFDTDYLVCVMSNDNHYAALSSITINQIKSEPMILRSSQSATRQLFESAIRAAGDSIDNFNVIIEVDNISTIKDLVRKNLGVSILPISACKNDVVNNRITAISIENLSMMREMNMVYTKDSIQTSILNEILKLYHETIA